MTPYGIDHQFVCFDIEYSCAVGAYVDAPLAPAAYAVFDFGNHLAGTELFLGQNPKRPLGRCFSSADKRITPPESYCQYVPGSRTIGRAR